ncbi:MAG: hypothetical protein S4CHLAM6_10880 [Chlamydiae bacterium]|nr:hypothetical protein [Chlamydiota bacterium]
MVIDIKSARVLEASFIGGLAKVSRAESAASCIKQIGVITLEGHCAKSLIASSSPEDVGKVYDEIFLSSSFRNPSALDSNMQDAMIYCVRHLRKEIAAKKLSGLVRPLPRTHIAVKTALQIIDQGAREFKYSDGNLEEQRAALDSVLSPASSVVLTKLFIDSFKSEADPYHFNCLMQDYVVPRANVLAVEMLLDKGAPVDGAKNRYAACQTPLNSACREGFVAGVELLLAKGAKTDEHTNGDSHPLMQALKGLGLAVNQEKPEQVIRDYEQIVKVLLPKCRRINMQECIDDMTPLMMAVEAQRIELVQAFCDDERVDFTLVNASGLNALEQARMIENAAIVEIIQSAIAKRIGAAIH